MGVCDTCYTMFGSGIVLDNVPNVTVRDNEVGPCPNCGRTGHTLDGVYSTTRHTVEAVLTPESSEVWRKALERLQAIQKKDGDEAAAQEAVKLFPGLASHLPQTSEARAAWLAVIFSALQLLVSLNQAPSSPTEVHNITVKIVNETHKGKR